MNSFQFPVTLFQCLISLNANVPDVKFGWFFCNNSEQNLNTKTKKDYLFTGMEVIQVQFYWVKSLIHNVMQNSL